MKVFNCIFGVFAILGAIYCMFFPGLTFLNAGWIVAILVGVLGICSIFESLSNPEKKETRDGKLLFANGIIGVIVGAVAVVVSILAIFSVAVRGMLDLIILYTLEFWIFYIGWMGIRQSIAMKKNGNKKWLFTLILGIFSVLAGFYGGFHLYLAAVTVGYVIGVTLLLYGIRLFASVFEENT